MLPTVFVISSLTVQIKVDVKIYSIYFILTFRDTLVQHFVFWISGKWNRVMSLYISCVVFLISLRYMKV